MNGLPTRILGANQTQLLRHHRKVELGVEEQREFERLGQLTNVRLSEQQFACALSLPAKLAPLQERHNVGACVEDSARGAAVCSSKRAGELFGKVGGRTVKHEISAIPSLPNALRPRASLRGRSGSSSSASQGERPER
jgi:hypothetical protein